MAQADPFSRVALQAIAAEMADWLEAAELPTDGVRIAATPLSIWEVRSGASLEEAARNSGEWHHQILKEGGAFAYARSRAAGEHAEIIELAESPLVEALDETLRSLRGTADDLAILRLLRSPRHQTTCLWLHREGGADEVIVLQRPASRVGERLEERAFLARLDSAPDDPVRG